MRHLKARLASLATAAASRLGYTLLPTWRMENLPAAQLLRALFDLLKIDCVIDVGANNGRYYRFLRYEVGYDGLVISFEPIPHLIEELRRGAAADPRWLIEGCALGAQPGTATLNVANMSVFSSFLRPLDDDLSRFDGKNTVQEQISCTVRTLAEILPQIRARHGVGNIFLKLDTQGFDLEILKGAGDLLATIPALQTELSVIPIYAGMPRYTETLAFLEQAGFALSGVFPVENPPFPLLVEMDCVLVNRARAAIAAK
jgi:FkbM family methyltransferase